MKEPTKVTAKYPIRVGTVMIPTGTWGDITTLEEARKLFPGIEPIEGSKQLCVKFPNVNPCIVHVDQVKFYAPR